LPKLTPVFLTENSPAGNVFAARRLQKTDRESIYAVSNKQIVAS
jgi:hypothetical protein